MGVRCSRVLASAHGYFVAARRISSEREGGLGAPRACGYI